MKLSCWCIYDLDVSAALHLCGKRGNHLYLFSTLSHRDLTMGFHCLSNGRTISSNIVIENLQEQ